MALRLRRAVLPAVVLLGLCGTACGSNTSSKDSPDAGSKTATTSLAIGPTVTFAPTGPTLVGDSCPVSQRNSYAADGLPGMVGDDVVQVAFIPLLSPPSDYNGRALRGTKMVIYVRDTIDSVEVQGAAVNGSGVVLFGYDWPPGGVPTPTLRQQRADVGPPKWWSFPTKIMVPGPGCYQLQTRHSGGLSVVQFEFPS